jgi:hypothetical protein
MAREVFVPYKPQRATLVVIDQANVIIDEYLSQRQKLTRRQLFYQFVARALIENTFRNYRRLRGIIANARDGGVIDWDAMEDRTRSVNFQATWSNPAARVRAAAHFYREDLWQGQLYRPEVWIEKSALLGVIEGICDHFRVPYFATIGNNSQLLQHEAGVRFARYLDQGLIPLVFHLADHDPNGFDMTRDVRERLALYARAPIEVRRIALNLDHVRQYNPPPNFAKETDSRCAAYVREFGTTDCWELDALSPTVIANLIRSELENLIDADRWNAAQRREQRISDGGLAVFP